MPPIANDQLAWSVGLSPSEPAKTSEAIEILFVLTTLVGTGKPLESIQSLSRGLYVAYKERTFHIFGNVLCPIVAIPRTPLQLPGFRHERKAD